MIYCKELAYTIMEAEKSQDLHSVSWRPRKVGLVPIGVRRPKNQESQWCLGRSKTQEGLMFQLESEGKEKLVLQLK